MVAAAPPDLDPPAKLKGSKESKAAIDTEAQEGLLRYPSVNKRQVNARRPSGNLDFIYIIIGN